MLRKSHPYVAAILLAACLATPSVGHALGLEGAGGKLGYTSPENRDATVMGGGHLELEQRGSALHFVPNVMFWKVGGESDLNTNLDAYYHFRPENVPSPYLGGGLGLNVRNSDRTSGTDTDLGANVIGGVRFPGQKTHYFMEGRFTASNVNQVAVLGGITFHTP